MALFPPRGYSGSVPGILHPSQVDFSIPFEYRSALYEETFSGTGTAGYIRPSRRGIDFWPTGDQDDVVVAQLITEIRPDSRVRFMVAQRFLIDHVGDIDAAFGLWSTDSNPFASLPTSGVYFKHVNGAQNGAVRVLVVTSGALSFESDDLFATTENAYYDVAVIYHKASTAEFLWLVNGRHWRSLTVTTGVPSAAMRPSMGALASFATLGGLVMRSFQLWSTGRND